MIIYAEDITNAIAKMLLNDVGIKIFCQDKFNEDLSGQDNSIYANNESFVGQKPCFTVVKLPELHRFNKALEQGIRSDWNIVVSFFGNFGTGQGDNQIFNVPTGAKVEINDVITYTPSDTMRILARMAGELVAKDIGCKVEGVLVSSIEIDAEDYYDAVNGDVSSAVGISLYENTTIYN